MADSGFVVVLGLLCLYLFGILVNLERVGFELVIWLWFDWLGFGLRFVLVWLLDLTFG